MAKTKLAPRGSRELSVFIQQRKTIAAEAQMLSLGTITESRDSDGWSTFTGTNLDE